MNDLHIHTGASPGAIPDGAPVTELLILGSEHLGSDTLDGRLAGTLERLSRWRPAVVGVEILSGELVDLYDRSGPPVNTLRYGGFPLAITLGRQAQAHTGWTRAEAAQIADDRTREPIERVLAHVAALEPWNALLHWSPGLALPPLINAGLNDLARSPAESVRLGVAVARRLGHERLCLFDEYPTGSLPAGLEAAITAGADTPDFQAWLAAHPFMTAVAGRPPAQEYWTTLQFLNDPAMVAANMAFERDANLRLGEAGRAKQADWEARNLCMAGRVRQASMGSVGGRVLAIVGHSHKGPMEAAMQALAVDLHVVDIVELDG